MTFTPGNVREKEREIKKKDLEFESQQEGEILRSTSDGIHYGPFIHYV